MALTGFPWRVLCGAALLAPALAPAAVLFRCDTADGSIAYTSSTKGYTGCKAIATFADAPKAPAKPKAAAPAAPARPVAAGGWVYQENPPIAADFRGVVASVAIAPADIARADFRRVAAAVASSADLVEPADFSTVLADVASSAPTLGNPLFIAARYRVRVAAPVAATPAVAASAGAAAPVASATPRVMRGAGYRVARKDGITEYTNVRPAGGAFAVLFTYITTCVACDLHTQIDFARTALHLDTYRAEIAAAAAEFGVDSALLHAVIHAESAFNPMALSRKGAQGLMQLMPGTATDMGVGDAFDASQNIRGGARYLATLLQSFNGDARLATAAYNAGPGAVQKYGGVPPYDETRVYVERVATLRERYAKAL